MQIRYGLNDRLPLKEALLFGLQWFAVAIPSVVIVGRVVAGVHHADPIGQVVYLQSLCFVMGATILGQVLVGHRLPLIAGPSTVLLIGILSAQGYPADTVYSSVVIGGILLALAGFIGVFGFVRRLFTPRIVASVLLLIAFTLTPTIMDLVTDVKAGHNPFAHLAFAFVLILAALYIQPRLGGLWKATSIIWMVMVGTLAYGLLFGLPAGVPGRTGLPFLSFFARRIVWPFSPDVGVLFSFLVCYLALSINDLGSMESLREFFREGDMGKRVRRGIVVTGLANGLAGLLGVLGPVNFSLSTGVIVSTGCGARAALIPAGLILAGLAFTPFLVGLTGFVPPVVIGAVLSYILCFQVVAGLSVMGGVPSGERGAEAGIVVAFPLLAGTVVSFFPPRLLEGLPAVLRPLLGNGFVVGVLTAVLLEHVVFRHRERGR